MEVFHVNETIDKIYADVVLSFHFISRHITHFFLLHEDKWKQAAS